MEGRKVINIFDHSAEILNYYRVNKFKKTRDGLKNSIFEWMDGEFYTTDKKTVEPFLEEYTKLI